MYQYYVYVHLRADTKQIFYVGKGKGTRSTSSRNRNKYWNNIVNKSKGFVTQLVSTNLSEKEALNFEILLIKKLKETGEKLANLTAGGEGTSGFKFTIEQKEKLSKAKLGKPASELNRINSANARIGRKVSEETKLKLSKKNKGYKHTETAKEKMGKSIICVTTNMVYRSASEAASALGLFASNISKECLGKLKHTGGYTFTYAQGITS